MPMVERYRSGVPVALVGRPRLPLPPANVAGGGQYPSKRPVVDLCGIRAQDGRE
jgi:hypothetical protein